MLWLDALVFAFRRRMSEILAQANFYQGKTVTVVVGSAPGGLYDLWARLLARTMGKYIPGNPKMLVQNMPGGGSIVAANYLYGIAKPDGLTSACFKLILYLEQLVSRPEVKFDMRQFNWLGSQEKGQMMLYIRADSPYKSIDDIIKAKEPPKCGGSGTADQSALLDSAAGRDRRREILFACSVTKAAVKSIWRWNAAK